MSIDTAPATGVTSSATYDGPIFDCDSHVHEHDFDFFKEYLPTKYHEKWLLARKVGPDGTFGLYIGNRRVHNAEANEQGLVPPPGKLKEWLRAMKEGKSNVEGWVKPTPEIYNRDARLRKLDEFGVEGAIVYPGEFIATVGYYDPDPSGNAVLNAYNRYLHERWSFNFGNRIYTTPVLSLWDLETSVAEAEDLIRKGVRIVVMPMGPAHNKSPADPYFDPIWSRLNEAGVAVAFHVSEATFMHPLIYAFGEKPLQSRRTGQTAWQWMFCYSEIPVQMTLANIVYHNFFERFPNIKMVSAENGSNWLPGFLEKMDKMRGMAKNGYWPCGQLKERPSRIFKRHCYVVAYPEDDVKGIVEKIGTADCLVMGSDFPHAEGVPEPRDFYKEALANMAPDTARAIMYDNGRRLMPRG
jgi:predicted TIM-barrel fold metal-dependent hydrolase